MYQQSEIQQVDDKIYQWYLRDGSRLTMLMSAMAHDFSIQDALFDYLEGKTAVAIMGGHKMKRASAAYHNVVLLAWNLAKNGFVVVTGGGPGAMEAANLGAYLYANSTEEVKEALELIGSSNAESSNREVEFLDREAPRRVLARFGDPSFRPSLGIPTWKYGHEPPNMFASWQAKMFSNALREDGIISIANAGVIFTPGSAGTRQEVFQDGEIFPPKK